MTTIQHKRGTAANWTSSNPVLEAAEIGYETDTGKFKIGDGTSTWSALSYFQIASGTDANYYPSAIVFNAGSSLGPTLDLTMSGTGAPDLTPVAIPSASASASGVVTTGTQTFAGSKTFTSSATFTGNVSITTAGAAALSIGRVDGTSSTPYIDFNSGATAIDYDSRIIASGGTGVSGEGSLAFYTSAATFLGNVVLAGTSASTDIRTLEITSQGFARIDMTGDSANAAGEPGGAAITFAVDSTASTYGIVSAVNAAGSSGVSGISYTGSLDNSMLVGTNGALPLTLGTNNNVRLTIDSAGDATFTGDVDIDGGDLTTSAATFNLINTTATNLNIGGAATTITIGAGTGNVNFNDNISAEGYITARRASNQDSVRLLGRAGGTGNYDAVITPTTLTASRTFTLPNASGTLGITEIEIGNAVNLNDLTTTGTYIQSSNAEAAAGTNYPEPIAGTLRVVSNSNGSEIWQTYHTLGGGNTNKVYQRGYYITWSAWKEVITASDAEEVVLPTPSAQYPANLTIPATSHASSERAAINLGAWQLGQDTAGNGTANFYLYGNSANAIVVDTSNNTTFAGDLAVNGGDITTTSTGTATLFNTNATTLNIGGAATTLNVGSLTTGTVTHNYSSSSFNNGTLNLNIGSAAIGLATRNINIGTGNITTASQTINIGTGALSSGTHAINIGSSTATTTIGGNVSVAGTIRSTYSSGSEGGELFLATPASSTTIDTGVAIDLYQNKFRIFESGGAGTRGYYLDITDGTSGAGINLRPPIYQKIIDATAAASSLGTVVAGGGTTYSAFGTNGVALKASTAYEVECLLLLTTNATSTSGTPATLAVALGSPSGAAVPTENQLYYTYSASTTALSNAAAVSGVHRVGTTTFVSLNTITIGTGTTNYLRAFIKGIVRINTAGNLTLRLAYTGATIGNITAINLGAGSYIKFTELGSNTVTDIGTWA